MGRDRPLRLFPVLAAAAGIAGCAAVPTAEGPAAGAVSGAATGAPAAPAADPRALVASSGGPGAQAALNGTLVLEDGCLQVVALRGERWVPVFGATTRWNAARLSVDTVAGASYRVGETVRLPGGTIAPVSWVKPPPAGCPGDKFWHVAERFMPKPASR